MRVYPLTGESSTPPTKRRWTTTPPTFKADLSGSAESIALSLRDVADINRQDVCRYKAQNEDDNGLFIIEGVGVVCGVRRVVAG